MTYAMNRVINGLMNQPAWVQNLITFSDILELVGMQDATSLRRHMLSEDIQRMARERRDNR